MQFSRVGNCFKISRITGPHHNFLGLEVAEIGASETIIEAFPPIGKQPIVLQANMVQKHVIAGVLEANKEFETKYVVTRIEFVPNDSPPEEIYQFLARKIIERLANKEPFPDAT